VRDATQMIVSARMIALFVAALHHFPAGRALERTPRLELPMQSGLASWYDDAGQTACGFHSRYGFASLFLPCGARVLMRGPGGSVIATMQDHGPYVGGRTFDLNPGLRAVLGCPDLCTVQWRLAQ